MSLSGRWGRVGALCGVALLGAALAVPAAHANGEYVNAGRSFSITGERTQDRVDVRVVDPAAGPGLAVGHSFEGGGGVAAALRAAGDTRRSREVLVWGLGQFRAVQGTNCTVESWPGGGAINCTQKGYDWTVGRYYRFVLVRGSQNDKGWRWTLRIVDQKTGTSTDLVSFRVPDGQLARYGHQVWIQDTPSTCSSVERVEGMAKRPVAEGSDVSWQGVTNDSTCGSVEVRSWLDGTTAHFMIR